MGNGLRVVGKDAREIQQRIGDSGVLPVQQIETLRPDEIEVVQVVVDQRLRPLPRAALHEAPHGRDP